MGKLARACALFLALIGLLFSPAEPPAQAQGTAPGEARQPLDIMLVIDNSCSMFPASQRVPGCEVWGNDPDFLRITGASLFIARMGFAQANAAGYQLGVISLGDNPPELVSPLTSLAQGRDALARAIASPKPKLATEIVPALEMAYKELKESPRRRPGNLPAVVLLTDGAPFPAEGQSNDDIRALVERDPDIPLFVMLLQNNQHPIQGFDRYVQFWEQMGRDHSYVQAYPVASTAEIERTYDEIVARLENTVARQPITLAPGQTLDIFVSKYVRRMVLTVARERGRPPGNIEIRDPNGTVVGDNDPGVERFRGADNPVEVIAIGPERLDRAPRDATWKVTSDSPVSVHLDMEGAYGFQFIEPTTSVTAVPGRYLAVQPQPPDRPFALRFRLVGDGGAAVTDPQPVRGRVTGPDGNAADLPVPADLRPAADGTYAVPFDFARAFPDAGDRTGRYTFSLEAGRIDDGSGGSYPIARAELLVDVGRSAYIAGLAPEALVCAPGRPVTLTVNLGDLSAAQAGSVRLSALAAGHEIRLDPRQGDAYGASLEPLCQALQTTLSCGTESDLSVRLRLLSSNADGSAAPPSERDVPVHVVAAACTATPTLTPSATPTPRPTATPVPTPTPSPTPVPDTDRDGYNDLADRCVGSPGWSILPYWGGCPPPLFAQVAGGVAGLGLLAFLAFYAVPLGLVMTVQPPPAGYVQVFRNGRAEGSYRSLRGAGQAARSSTVTIGSQGIVRVAGLEPVELRVERRGENGVVLRGAKGPQLFTIRDIPASYTAANGTIVLKFALDPRNLRSS
jgi:hypothetical protein